MRYSKKFERGQKLPDIFYYSFGGVGFLLLAIASVIFYFNHKSVNQFIRTEGVVIENRFEGGKAIITYNWEGTEREYISSTTTNPPAFEIGEKVEIFINPSDPDDVLINSFSERYLAITIVGGIGAVFLGFLTLFHYLSTKQ